MKNFFNNSTVNNIVQVMLCRYGCFNAWIVPKGNETTINKTLLGLVMPPNFVKIFDIVCCVFESLKIFTVHIVQH